MPKRLLIFATLAEAAATLHTLEARPLDGAAFTFEGGVLLLCGMGIQLNLTPYIKEADEVWNLGLAGSLRAALPIGTLLQVKRVGASERPAIQLGEGRGTLFTSPVPVHDHQIRQNLGKEWELVDMEGYGIAQAARELGKKCLIWKIVSDFASPGGAALIRKNMARSSEHLAEKIHATIHESRSHPSIR